MDQRLEDIGNAILAACRSGIPIDRPESTFGPLSEEDAYAIHAHVVAGRGKLGGWKIGAASPEATPIVAPIMASDIIPSGSMARAPGGRDVGIELEIAFRLAKDFAPRAEPYSRDDILAGIDAVIPVIELCDSRLAPIDELDANWKLADAQINMGLVLGEMRPDRLDMDAGTADVRLTFNGEIIHQGSRRNNAGDPLRLLTWMANERPAHCGGMKTGQIVTTGSLTGIDFVPPGTKVEASIAGLGDVAVIIER